jgi:membrane associated rhomboid family serine protease
MEKLRQILAQQGPLGWLLAILASSYLTVLMGHAIFGSSMEPLFGQLAMPMEPLVFIRQPWSLFTYWAFHPPAEFWIVLVDMSILYAFGAVLQRTLGRKRFVWALLIFGLGAAAISLGLVPLLPMVRDFPAKLLHGMHPVNAAIIAACVVTTPRIEFRFFGQGVQLRWIALFVVVVSLLGTKAFFTTDGVAYLAGMSLGLGYAFYVERFGGRNKWDVRIRQQTSLLSPKNRVRVKETHQNPQHKGKFTVVHSTAKLAPEDELNRLLDRINEVGYNGLTANEKRRLEELSGQ